MESLVVEGGTGGDVRSPCGGEEEDDGGGLSRISWRGCESFNIDTFPESSCSIEGNNEDFEIWVVS